MSGELSILNVAGGDTKLTFDNEDPAETLRARRIVRDMLRRGYMLMVQDTDGKYVRALDFDEESNEYLIADFDPTAGEDGHDDGAKEPESKATAPGEAPGPEVKKKRGRRSAKTSKAVAVPPVAGG